MSVYAPQHAKDLHATDHVLSPSAGMGKFAVLLALHLRERRRGRRLMHSDGVPVTSPQTLISRVPDKSRIVGKSYAIWTEQLQVMNRPSTRRSAQNALGHGADQQLKFQSMLFLLPAVPASLLFLGRSHETSEASTAMML